LSNTKAAIPVAALPMGTVVGERYRAGAPLSFSRQSLCYEAWDLQKEETVLLEEFFPTPVSGREPQTNNVVPSAFSDTFRAACSLFLASKQLRALPLLSSFSALNTAYRVYRAMRNSDLLTQSKTLLDIPIYFRDALGAPIMSINALPIPSLPSEREFGARSPKRSSKWRNVPKNPAQLTVHASVISHVGRIRKNNEDNFHFNEDYMPLDEIDGGACISHVFEGKAHVFAICDGMGGHNAGERASLIVVQSLSLMQVASMKPNQIQPLLENHAQQLTESVWKDGITNKSPGQGTTLALLVIKDNQGFLCNVGDSRIYVLRAKELFLLSHDHTKIHELVLAGRLSPQEERNHPEGNVITRYVGMSSQNAPSPFAATRQITLCDGDRFLICSDGLSDLLRFDTIHHCLMEQSEPLQAVRKLTVAALEAGGKDNVTCMVLDIHGGECLPPTQMDLASLSLQTNISAITEDNRETTE